MVAGTPQEAGADALIHRVRPSAGEPEGALVLFHGRGTSEHDLFDLLDALDPERRLVGVTPRAPYTMPPGGAHWYAVHRVGFPDPATFAPTFATASGWLDAFLEREGVPIERTVLGGFSQGAVMSYALGLGPGRPLPAGIVALSGFMPVVDGFPLREEGLEGFPVTIAHGEHDPVISVEFGRDARDRLTAADADVVYRESPMPHTVDPRGLPELAERVAAAVARTRV